MASAHSPSTLSMSNVTLSTIKPFEKTAHVETIEPSLLDVTMNDAFIPTFFAYRLASNSETVYLQFVNRIKESLQKVLIPFFPFAGRWIATAQRPGRQLVCDDSGVPFIEVYVNDDLDYVVRASTEFQPVPELQGHAILGMDASQFKAEMVPEGLPGIFVQVTRFKCGGVVVAVTFNHVLTDGKGFFNFMTAWSDISRTNGTAVKVDNDRALVTVSYPHLKPTDEVRADVLPGKLVVWPKINFEVSVSTINSLKQEAKGSKEGAFVSTADCITAHVWKSLSRLPSSMLGENKIAVSIAAEGRTKFFDPPQPDLCGNAVLHMVAPLVPTNELSEIPVVSLALKLREKIRTTSRKTWLSPERIMAVEEIYGSGKFHILRVTSWFNFPIYEIDFGAGKPYFSSGINNTAGLHTLGLMYIGPPIPGSSSVATVSFGSIPEVQEALQRDPEFLSFFCKKA